MPQNRQQFPDHEDDLRNIRAQAGYAFDELVALRCDSAVLGRLLVLLRHPLTPKGKSTVFVQDSHEAMLNGMSAREAKRMLAKALAATTNLRAAMRPFADAPVWHGVQSPEPDYGEICDSIEAPIRALEARIGETGPQKTPAFEWRVRAIIKYVRKATDGYHDELVAEILGAASPPGYPTFPSGEALRKWRGARGIIDESAAGPPCESEIQNR